MLLTKAFRNGNFQAVRIPAEIADISWEGVDLEIERVDEELHIRPVRRRLNRALDMFASFSSDFMNKGRDDQEQAERETW